MPLTQTLPFVEEKLVAYLKTYAALSALTGTRVSTKLPPSPTFPSVRLQRIGGIPDRYGTDQAQIQFDCYGRTQQEAWAVFQQVFKASVELPQVQPIHGSTVFMDVVQTTPANYLPDTDLNAEGGQPRYIGAFAFTARTT